MRANVSSSARRLMEMWFDAVGASYQSPFGFVEKMTIQTLYNVHLDTAQCAAAIPIGGGWWHHYQRDDGLDILGANIKLRAVPLADFGEVLLRRPYELEAQSPQDADNVC